VAEARALILAIGVILLAARHGQGQIAGWAYAGALIAVLSLAGAPLTVGFAGRGSLYASWLQSSRFVFVLVAAVIHVALVAAGLRIIRHLAPLPRTVNGLGGVARPAGHTVSRLSAGLAAVLWILPAGFLLAWRPLRADLGIGVWLALLLPLALGLLMNRFVGENEAIAREAAAVWSTGVARLPIQPVLTASKRALTALSRAIREAGRLLEGEGGMLWLLLWIVLFWLARQG
jgi:hypothetical protein